MQLPTHVGTSGWQYDSWHGVWYPSRLPRRAWLAHYASTFSTVEVDSTFCGLPSAATVAGWRDATPEGFTFALKVSRYLTHRQRLVDPADAVARFMERASLLGAKLGPLLLQLPPTLPVRLDRLRATVDAFPPGRRLAVEFRHASWWTPEVRAFLESRGIALCLADRRSRPVGPLWRTADWGYVRLHAGRATPSPHYGDGALRAWAERIRSIWLDDEGVFVYFNNDAGGWAPRDAATLRRYLCIGAGGATRRDAIRARPAA